MFQLNDKIAVVTGAGSGMGRADALLLAEQGATVAVSDVNEDACRQTVDDIAARGGTAMAVPIDVRDVSAIERGFDSVVEAHGRVDILVNNAGVFQSVPSLDLTEEDWQNVLDTDLKGQFFCAQRAAKEMQKNGWGRIVNISSISCGGTGIGIQNAAHYTAAKGGIIGLTETLANEWAQYGITVNAIAPGAIDTPMLQSAGFSKDAMNALLQHIPMGKAGTPEDVAAAVVFLASEEAKYITGSTLAVDGGWLAA